VGPETANGEMLTTLVIVNFCDPAFVMVNDCGELNPLTLTDPKLSEEGALLTLEFARRFVSDRLRRMINKTEHTSPRALTAGFIDFS
jgi:hypothetical protein